MPNGLTATLVATATLCVLVMPDSVSAAVAAGSQARATLCDGELATIVGTSGNDELVGTVGPDVIAGLGGEDKIDSGGGDDLVCGGDGSDHIRGEAGDDQLFADRAGLIDGKTRPDWLEGGSGDDLLDIGEREQGASGPSGAVLFTSSPTAIVVDLNAGTATGEGVDIIVPRPGIEVVGSAYADVIDGSDRDDWLYGYVGDDRLRGLGGDDELVLDTPDSEYVAGTNNDWADGGPGDDYVGGAEGSDTLRGGPGSDFVESRGYAASGPSQLFGDSGNDELRAKLTDEHVLVDGGSGRDDVTLNSPRFLDPKQSRVTVRMVPQTLELGASKAGRIRRVESVSVLDRMQLDYYGSPRADRVYAGDNARLRAWTLGGGDVVRGSRRSDFVDSGPGKDAVWAGSGRDRCLHAERRRGCEVLRP